MGTKKTYSLRYVERLREQIREFEESDAETRRMLGAETELSQHMEMQRNAAIKSQTAAEAEVERLGCVEAARIGREEKLSAVNAERIAELQAELIMRVAELQADLDEESEAGMSVIHERNARDVVIVEQALEISTLRWNLKSAQKDIDGVKSELWQLEAAAKKRDQS